MPTDKVYKRAPSTITVVLAFALAAAAGCSGGDDPAPDKGPAPTDGPARDTGAQADRGAAADTRPAADASAACAGNKLIQSCLSGFLKGCWAPNLSGTCTDGGTKLEWSDGHKIIRLGTGTGLYAPGAGTPCISFTADVKGTEVTITYKKGSQTIVDKNAGGNHTVTCPDSSTFTYTDAEGVAANKCLGIMCP